MADNTPIEWADATWNPVRGCTRVSPGCGGPNHEGGCYAEKIAARFSMWGQPYHGFAEPSLHGGRWTGKVALIESALDWPLRWKKPRRIFVNSMSDWAHERLSFADMARIVDIARNAPHHRYLLLTKRAARQREFAEWWCTQHAESSLPSCMWLGVSVEDQERADERIPELLATPAAMRFISAEPLLAALRIDYIDIGKSTRLYPLRRQKANRRRFPDGGIGDFESPVPFGAGLDWIIVGGESGKDARPMHPDWARSLRDQCQAAGVSFFYKQAGEYVSVSKVEGPGEHYHFPDGATVRRIGKKAAGRLLDGREWSEFPG